MDIIILLCIALWVIWAIRVIFKKKTTCLKNCDQCLGTCDIYKKYRNDHP